MGILSWIVVGLVAGWLAGLVLKGKGFGLVGNVIVGVIGALIGGFLAAQIFDIPNAINGITLNSILIAFVGAVVFLAVLRLFTGGRAG